MATPIKGELDIELSKAKARLAEAEAELKRFKAAAKQHAHGAGSHLAEGIKEGLERTGLKEVFMAAIGGGTLVGATESAHALVEGFAKLYDQSLKLGVSTDSIQRLNAMAKLSGMEVGALVGMLDKFKAGMENVGDPKIVKAMKDLKLDAVALAGEAPEKQLEMIAEAYNAAQKAGTGDSALRAILGKSAVEAKALLRDFEETKHAAAKIPLISDEDMKRADELDDWISSVWMTFKARAYQSGTAFFSTPDEITAAETFVKAHQDRRKPDTSGGWLNSIIDIGRAQLEAVQGHEKELVQTYAEKGAAIERVNEQRKADELEIAKIRQEAELNDVKLMGTRAEQIAKMKEMLGQSLGINVTSAEDVTAGLKKLREEADAAAKTGDKKAALDALDKWKMAQKEAMSFADIGAKSGQYGVAGDAVSAMNILTGRSGDSLVADDTHEMGETLKRIERAILDGNRALGGENIDARTPATTLHDYFHGH